MNTKLTKAAAVTAALLPALSLAAIDDQGMQYVTAAEGLHGSLRVDILHNTDEDLNDNAGLKGGAENSLRLWVNGTADLGGGLASTYYWEMRSNKVGEAVGTQAWDLGLTGPFGDVKFGKLGMVAPRLVPGASLAFERGSSRFSLGSDPIDNGLRWESPVFNGVKVGISAVIADNNATNAGTDDDTVDEWSFAGKYDSPLGFSLGAGYEIKKLPHDAADIVGSGTDDATGWRFGARYGQDNWLVGYEYRGYKALNFDDLGSSASPNVQSTALVTFDTVVRGGIDTDVTTFVGANDISYAPFVSNDSVKYSVHAFGAQVKVDRVTASANYSIEKIKASSYGIKDLGGDTLAVDVAYALGSRSTVVLGWLKSETTLFIACFGAAGDPCAATPATGTTFQGANGDQTASIDKSETYLFYRVDF